jgi:hypothetical protein
VASHSLSMSTLSYREAALDTDPNSQISDGISSIRNFSVPTSIFWAYFRSMQT